MHTHLLCLMECVHFWSSGLLSFLWVFKIKPSNFYNFHHYRVQVLGSSFPKWVILSFCSKVWAAKHCREGGREGDTSVRISQRCAWRAHAGTGTPGRNCSLWRAHARTDLSQRTAASGKIGTRTGESIKRKEWQRGTPMNWPQIPCHSPSVLHSSEWGRGRGIRNERVKLNLGVEGESRDKGHVLFLTIQTYFNWQ